MKKLTVIILSALFFTACSKESDILLADNAKTGITSSGNLRQNERPFKGSFFTSIDPDPSNTPLVCSGGFPIPGRLLVHGNATHLGELIWQESTLQHSSCALNTTTLVLTTVVTGQLTASNGDRIFYSGNDVIDVSNLLTGNGPTGTIAGEWTITGGTGRFQGASGSITISGSVDFTTIVVSFEAIGTITY